MDKKAIQDQVPDNYCYGCGPANESGLRLKSFWDGDETVATFMPEIFHSAGPRQFLNGGIIATLIDCHCVCTAIADRYLREKREIGTEPYIWYVTGSLRIDYNRPVPIDRNLHLRARIIEAGQKKTKLSCSLFSGNQECARGEVVALNVPDRWRNP